MVDTDERPFACSYAVSEMWRAAQICRVMADIDGHMDWNGAGER